MRMTDTKLLTPKEVADHYGLKPRTIARWCREGKLDAVKVGRVWRIRALSGWPIHLKPETSSG